MVRCSIQRSHRRKLLYLARSGRKIKKKYEVAGCRDIASEKNKSEAVRPEKLNDYRFKFLKVFLKQFYYAACNVP